ncbi:17914_t:CDS:2, partial [Funneliformis caledonium]
LSKVLAKYSIDSNSTNTIPLFSLQTYEIQESDKHFKHCIVKILVRLKNYETLVVDSLEAICNEYVAILHITINITRDSTREEFSMRPEYEVIGNESTRQVNFTIKKAKNLICVTKDKSEQNLIE